MTSDEAIVNLAKLGILAMARAIGDVHAVMADGKVDWRDSFTMARAGGAIMADVQEAYTTLVDAEISLTDVDEGLRAIYDRLDTGFLPKDNLGWHRAD